MDSPTPPASSEARDRAVVNIQAGNIPGAIQHLLIALEQNPQDWVALGYLGICYCRQGNLPQGTETLRRAVEGSPQDAALRFNLANALVQGGHREEASAHLRVVLSIQPNHAGALRLASQLGVQADPPEVVEVAAAPIATEISPASGTAEDGSANVATGMSLSAAAVEPNWVDAPIGTRLGRGVLWGVIGGQIWTLLSMFWELVHVATGKSKSSELLVGAIIYLVLHGGAGLIVGLTAAGLKADAKVGSWIGVGLGFVLMWLEFVISGEAMAFVNVLFWFFSGQLVGGFIAKKVNQPVEA